MKNLTLVLASAMAALGFVGPAAAQVYRCGSAYQSTPCAGGRVVVDAPARPVVQHKTSTVYLCESYQGRTFWASEHCNNRRPPSVLKRMVDVPAYLSWEEKVEVAAGVRRAADALSGPDGAPGAPGRSNSTGGSSPNLCHGYTEALRHNDSQARAGGTAARMEYLSEERRRILREQSQARCR